MPINRPVFAKLEITPNCPARCSYCGPGYGFHKTAAETPLETFQEVLKVLQRNEIMLYILTGGEPFLRKDLVYAAINSANKVNAFVTINSNGILINDDDIETLVAGKVSRCLISLPSSHETDYHKILGVQNAFSRSTDTIRKLSATNIRTTVNMVVTKQNLDQVVDTGKYVRDLGTRHFSATPIQPTYPNHKDLMLSREEFVKVCDDLIELYNCGLQTSIQESFPFCVFDDPKKYARLLKGGCGAGSDEITISASGYVKPCGMIPTRYGNLLTEPLNEIMVRLSEFNTNPAIPENSLIPKECLPCAEFIRCSGACRLGAKTLFGSYDKPNQYFTKPLTKRVLTPKPTPQNFFDHLTFNLDDALGYSLQSSRARAEPDGMHTIMTDRLNVIRLPQALFNILDGLAIVNPKTREELQIFAESTMLTQEEFNEFLNIISIDKPKEIC